MNPIAIDSIRHELVNLHKAMLDSERESVERERGRLSAGEFLQLVISDDAFAWLRPISGLVVRMDEWLEDETSVPGGAAALIAEARRLTTSNADGDAYERRYAELLQRRTEVVLAHAALTRVLSSQRAASSATFH